MTSISNIHRISILLFILLLASCGNLKKTSPHISPESKNDITATQQVIIILYDSQTGNKPLLEAIKAYNATIIYEYHIIKGVAVAVNKEQTKEAIDYFYSIDGVVSVTEDQTMELHHHK